MMRKGDWIQTFTGIRFYPLDPRPEDIDIHDIAHALSMTCRYNGHCRVFYSVAEHSYIMSVSELPGDPAWLLMHDAAEAYLSDIPKPIKPMLPEFKIIEESILKVIGERFGLGGEPDHKAIKYSDMVLLATEKRDVLSKDIKWGLQLPAPLLFRIEPHLPYMAERMFLTRADQLGIR